MAPASPPTSPMDERRLQAFLATSAKYNATPVPTPLNRTTAVAFVNARVKRNATPPQIRKLARVAIFYRLSETSQAFASVLTGKEDQPVDIERAALCLIALTWIGDAGQQATVQQYFHALQDRANVETDRAVMLEVVEALGPREGTGPHRQWIQKAIGPLEAQQRQAEASKNVPGAKLAREKANQLKEYLNIELAAVDRGFARRQRIDAMPPATQIQPLVAYSLETLNDSSPELSFWASMRLLGFEAALYSRIAAEFSAAAAANAKDDLIRARALRAAVYFGVTLSHQDHEWLEAEPDTGADPLVLRPQLYTA